MKGVGCGVLGLRFHSFWFRVEIFGVEVSC